MKLKNDTSKKKSDVTERITITLPHEVLADYREIAQMTGCSISSLIRRRLEVRGGIVAVSEPLLEELRQIHILLANINSFEVACPSLLLEWAGRVEQYDRLLDFNSSSYCIHAKKKRRASHKKSEGAALSKKKAATSCASETVSQLESGALEC